MPENLIKLFATVIIISKVSGHICGGGRFGNCFQKCIRECITRSNGVSDPNVLDDIVTEKIICEGKCRGEILSLDPKSKLNQDLKDCSRPCAAPTSEYCFKGFLTLFLYCDCHACCAALPTNERRVNCAVGCLEWFLKPEAPGGINVCRFKSEYQQTPNNWCTAYCAWQLIKLRNYEAKQYPEIISRWGKSCIAGCVGHIQNGVKIDYLTAVPRTTGPTIRGLLSRTSFFQNGFPTYFSGSSCVGTVDLWQCVDTIKVTNFVIPVGITDQQLTAAAKTPDTLGTGFGYHGDVTYPRNETFNDKEFYELLRLEIDWPRAVFPVYNRTLKITEKIIASDAATRVQLPSSKASRFPWNVMGELIVRCLSLTDSGCCFGTHASKWNLIEVHYTVDLDSCTNFDQTIIGQKQEFSFQIELYAEISNQKTILPLSAQELRAALRQRTEWEEFTYVRDIGDHAIEVKAVANASASVILNKPKLAIYNCTKHPNCPNPTWKAANNCKLRFQNSSIEMLTTTYTK